MPVLAQYAVRVTQEFLNFNLLNDYRLVLNEHFFCKIMTESNIISYLFKTIVEYIGSSGAANDSEVGGISRKFNGSNYTELEMLKLCYQKCLKVASWLDVLINMMSIMSLKSSKK